MQHLLQQENPLVQSLDLADQNCSTLSLFVLFLVAYKGAGSFAKVNVLLFAGLMLSLALGIGSIFMG